MAELKDSCVKPARGPIMPAIESSVTSEKDTLTKEAIRLFDTPQLIIYNI